MSLQSLGLGGKNLLPEWYHMAVWVGPGGGGKTTGMVRDLIKEMDEGTQYDLAYINLRSFRHPKVKYIDFEHLKDLRHELERGRPRVLVCLDQLHKYSNARQSMCPRNIYFNDIVTESRQHGFDLRGTTWGVKKLDGGVRKYLNLVILSESTTRGFRYQMLDENNERLKSTPLMPFENCEKYWKHFDMNELVEFVDPDWDPRKGPLKGKKEPHGEHEEDDGPSGVRPSELPA